MTPRFGRYEVTHKLGEGAMAAVFLARDPVLTRSVAIKVLHQNVAGGKTVLQRFFNEAKTVANIRNPHVVEVFDFGREGSEYYLVMEFVDGLSLHGVLKQLRPDEPLSDLLTAALLCQAAEGLDSAARHGVVHRDIKPENLMINQQGYMKIADFGIAHLQDESLTRTGAVLGSPLYMSPEQVRGAKPITSQSDMFSMGAVLYRCLAGAPPFSAATLKELYVKIAREPHTALWHIRPDLDPALSGLVETLLQKDPAQRGGGPRWMRAELRAYLLSKGVDDPTDLVSRHLRELAQRGIQTTWRLGPNEPILPRTVAATAPMLPDTASATGYAPSRAIPDETRKPGQTQTMPTQTLAVRKTNRLRFYQLLAIIGVVAVGFAGANKAYSKWFKRIKVQRAPAGWAPASHSAGMSGSTTDFSPSSAGPGSPTGVTGPDIHWGSNGTGSVPDLYEQMFPDPMATSIPDAGTGNPADAKPPAEKAVVETVSLLVQSSPPFAFVFLDGRAMGVTPIRLPDVESGPHRLLIQGRTGEPMDTLLRLPPGRRAIKVQLDPGAIAFENEE